MLKLKPGDLVEWQEEHGSIESGPSAGDIKKCRGPVLAADSTHVTVESHWDGEPVKLARRYVRLVRSRKVRAKVLTNRARITGARTGQGRKAKVMHTLDGSYIVAIMDDSGTPFAGIKTTYFLKADAQAKADELNAKLRR